MFTIIDLMCAVASMKGRSLHGLITQLLVLILLCKLNEFHDFILDHFQLANFALDLILVLRRIV